MPVKPVVNASPLIYLSKGGFLDLLQLVGGEIVVPAVVANEIRKRGQADPTVQALENRAWLTVLETPPVPPIIQAWDLGPGESSVLAYAYATREAVAILDDLAGRRCAEALNIPINGTLGLGHENGYQCKYLPLCFSSSHEWTVTRVPFARTT